MKNLLRFSLAQTVFINVVFVLLMIVGAYAFLRMPVERYPNVKFGKILIDTFYPGASPSDVEALVTREIEDALEDLEDVEFIRATSYRERSSIVVKFIDDTDYRRGYNNLRFKVLSILDELPPEVDPPSFDFIDVNDWLPVVSINLIGDRSNRALTLMAEEMKVPLERLPGVKEVRLQGEYVREFHLYLDPARLSRYGITFDQVAQALLGANISIPAGDHTTLSGEFVIQVDEKLRTRELVMNTIVRKDGEGSYIRIGDLATAALLSYREPFVITSVNGQDCVTLQVIKTGEGNALNIIEQVKSVAAQFKPNLRGEGVSIVFTQDSTIRISDSMRTLGLNLLLGIVLVSLLLWLFLGFRNAALTTIGIPFAFLVTMVIMYVTGNSLNEISLFSFVLVSGIIVDDAIVVCENIYRHLQRGKKLEDAIVDGTAEVFLPVVSATLTTVAAFLPMLIMTGSTGEFFAVIPKAISFALLASVIECLLILPSHYLEFGPRAGKMDKQWVDSAKKENPVMAWTRIFCDKLLKLALRYRVTSLLLVFVAFIAALFIVVVSLTGKIPLLKIKFFPEDYSLYYVEVRGPVGTPIEETSRYLKSISKFIVNDGKGMARSAAAFAGFYINEDYQPVFGDNLGNVIVTLPPRRERRFSDYPENDPQAHLERMRKRLAPLARSGYRINIRPELEGPPTGKDVNIRVLGSDIRSVQGLAQEVLAFLREDELLSAQLEDLQDNQGQPSRIFRFHVRHDRAYEHGVTPAKVAALAAAVLDGRVVGKFRVVDEDVDLKLKLDPEKFKELADAFDIPLIEHPEGPIRLGDLVSGEVYLEPGYLNRFRNQRAITLTANIQSGSALSAAGVVQMVRTYYRTISDEHPGAILDFAGEFEETRRSYTSLAYAFCIALLLIYLILATQFRSYLQPLIIISAVVFALIGVIFGKLISQSLFTVNSFIAVVGVTGVVVNDSLVLIEFINKRRRAGLSRREAILEGTHIRLRPILLTTLTTTLGLLPMSLGIPEYSMVWGTMATTFVTGLCTATFLTVVIVPVEWDILEGLTERIANRKSLRRTQEEARKPVEVVSQSTNVGDVPKKRGILNLRHVIGKLFH